MQTAEGEGELGGGCMTQTSWPWRAGKELVFYSKIKGVTFGVTPILNAYSSVCILNAYSSVCIESGLTQELGTQQALEIEIRNPHFECY